MATFQEALDKTLNSEGFYVNTAKDKGCETYCGISRNNFPDWEGWTEVDKFKAEHGLPQYGMQIHGADKFVENFYLKSFWNPLKLDLVADQGFANLIFDVGVNSGVRSSVLMLQEVLHDCFGFLDMTLDGKIGQKTIDALNTASLTNNKLFGSSIPGSYLFLVQMTAIRMKRFARLAKDGDAWAIVGWTQRAFSYLGSK